MTRKAGWLSVRHTGPGLAAAILAVAVGVSGCGAAGAVSVQSAPSATSSTAPIATPSTDSSTEAPSPTASGPSGAASEIAPSIPPSVPREAYFPRAGVTVPIDGKPCPVVNGLLDPDRTAYGVACFYTAADKPYTLPASGTKDVTVLAGHTYRFGQAAFNVLYDWKAQTFAAAAGDELWLRTEASGDQWLVYRAIAFHTPPKSGLATDASVWGTGPLPNRLLTIGCLQPTDLKKAATQNVVVAWDFARVARR